MGPEHPSHAGNSADWFDLLDRYYAGECTPDECAVVERQLATRPRVIHFFRALRQVLYGTPVGQFDVRGSLQRIKAGGEQRQTSQRLPRGADRRQRSRAMVGRRWAWSAIPVFVVGCLIAIIAWSAGAHHLSRREAALQLTYTTGNAQRANVTLPDGNTVALNVASRLEVPADYVGGHHTVHLTGEALFTVIHHEGSPFTVISGATATRVLGTSFAVRHYPTDTVVNVAVREGKVAVRTVVVTAAHQVEVGQAGALRVEQADPSRFSFANGVLTLEGVPLREGIVMLNRWFDADIRLGDAALAKRRIAGDFTAGSLDDLKESLELMFNARVVREGRILTVYSK